MQIDNDQSQKATTEVYTHSLSLAICKTWPSGLFLKEV